MAKRAIDEFFWSIFKFIVAFFGLILMLIGLVVSPSPVPFGFVPFILGLFLFSAAAPDFIRWLRRRWRWLDRQLNRLEKNLPDWIAKHLRRSGVDYQEDDSEEEEQNSGTTR